MAALTVSRSLISPTANSESVTKTDSVERSRSTRTTAIPKSPVTATNSVPGGMARLTNCLNRTAVDMRRMLPLTLAAKNGWRFRTRASLRLPNPSFRAWTTNCRCSCS
jgi:hypothetical protein